MPPVKRPASAEKGPRKRPASSINQTVREIKEQSAAMSDTRDKGKGEKFAKMLKAGTLPPEVVHMWSIESKKAPSERAFKTELINSLFAKQKDGSYRIDTDSHQFAQYRKVHHAHIAKTKDEALPKNLMIGTHFSGDERLFNRALEDKELTSFKDEASGIEYYSFRKLQAVDLHASEQGEHVHGYKKLGKDQAYTLGALMTKMKWDFKMTKAQKTCL